MEKGGSTMNKKEILELKKRWTKNGCTFTRLCGCYVDAEKNVLLRLGETFLTLDDEEFYKYLDIAKKNLVRHTAKPTADTGLFAGGSGPRPAKLSAWSAGKQTEKR